ncbi:2-thiouracil desulfurase family protein [Bacillus xiamenensis]|uniref:2-thiouracil desulfurase family protein n=1 Tax=Bacillus xiamenensis TaxID=1178537 RepID=UPI000AFFB6F1|nr:2-thiouracil desulfurase family protein [Bacillus xiamenensis]
MTVCPELLGGFSTPRSPAEFIGGDGHDVLRGQASVVDVHGTDVTEMYVKGAKVTLEQVSLLKQLPLCERSTAPQAAAG